MKAGLAAGAAIWVAPQISSYALAQTVGSAPPSAQSGRGGDAGKPVDPAHTGNPANTADSAPSDSDSRRRPAAPEAVVGDPRFTG